MASEILYLLRAIRFNSDRVFRPAAPSHSCKSRRFRGYARKASLLNAVCCRIAISATQSTYASISASLIGYTSARVSTKAALPILGRDRHARVYTVKTLRPRIPSDHLKRLIPIRRFPKISSSTLTTVSEPMIIPENGIPVVPPPHAPAPSHRALLPRQFHHNLRRFRTERIFLQVLRMNLRFQPNPLKKLLRRGRTRQN